MLNYKPTVPKFLPHFPTCYNRKVKFLLEFQGPSAVAHTRYLRSCHCPAQSLSFSAALAFFLLRAPVSFPQGHHTCCSLCLECTSHSTRLAPASWHLFSSLTKCLNLLHQRLLPLHHFITWGFCFSCHSENWSVYPLAICLSPGQEGELHGSRDLASVVWGPRAAPRSRLGPEGRPAPYVGTPLGAECLLCSFSHVHSLRPHGL